MRLRILLVLAVLASLLAVPSVAAAAGAATFHGTFDRGELYVADGQEAAMLLPAAEMGFPVDGDGRIVLSGTWNLNISAAGANALLLVRNPFDPPYGGRPEMPGGPQMRGLDAIYTPGWFAVAPVTEAFGAGSAVGTAFPTLAGRTNDPSSGAYLYASRVNMPFGWATLVLSYDAATHAFFYVGVPDDPGLCPLVMGDARR